VTLQIYCSGFIFAPEKSFVREIYQDEGPRWIAQAPRVQAHWGAALATLEGYSQSVWSVAFSPDDSTARLWDAESGAALATLEGHSNSVGPVAFLLDGKRVAAGAGSVAPSSTTASDEKPREAKSTSYKRVSYETVLATKGSFIDNSIRILKKQVVTFIKSCYI
jgi:WD40 repeat protein